MEWIIVFMRNNCESAFWKKGMFFGGKLQSSVRNSHRSENFDVRYWATPIIITLMPMFATYRVKVERIILFVKLWSGILKEKHVFQRHQFRSFDGSFMRIKGAKTGRIFCSRYSDNYCLHLPSETFVSATESNLSLATGLASWKVSLKPCKLKHLWKKGVTLQPYLPIMYLLKTECKRTFWKESRLIHSSHTQRCWLFLEEVGPWIILLESLPNKQSSCLFSQDNKWAMYEFKHAETNKNVAVYSGQCTWLHLTRSQACHFNWKKQMYQLNIKGRPVGYLQAWPRNWTRSTEKQLQLSGQSRIWINELWISSLAPLPLSHTEMWKKSGITTNRTWKMRHTNKRQLDYEDTQRSNLQSK